MFGTLHVTGDFNARAFSLVGVTVNPDKKNLAEMVADDIQTTITPFSNGKTLRIFNRIAEGEVIARVTIDLERPLTDSRQSFQRGVDRKVWARLFGNELPAKLHQKDEGDLDGFIMPFYETGMEETAWVFYKWGSLGHNGLNFLQDGDELTIYSKVTAGNAPFESVLEMEDKVFNTGETGIVASGDSPSNFSMRDVGIQFIHTAVSPSHQFLERVCQSGFAAELK